MRISELFNIQRRFLRSTNIERDFGDETCLDGYVVTPHVHESICRINAGLASRSSLRSWRITGDYGSGKSSFAILLAQLYARRESELQPRLRNDLSEPISAIRSSGAHFHPVLVSGTREALSIALVRALGRSLQQINGSGCRTRSKAAEQIAELLSRPQSLSDQAALESLAQVHAEVVERGLGTGLLIILDELGKFLEYAALHPERQDVFLLQQLAEMSARSPGKEPLFVVGLLHQGFGAYSEMLSQSAQREWEKIAGRFEELLFDQPLEQIAYLTAEALSIKKESLTRSIELSAKSAMREALAHRWYGAAAPSQALQSLAPRLYPLHASVVPCLARFFRRWGQNERSLYSFLLSSEACGLQEFARETVAGGGYYRIHNLYDYVATNFGHRLSSQSYRSHWNHIDSLIRSFSAADKTELAVLKTVGVLNLIDTPEMVPTAEVILFALSEGKMQSQASVSAAIERLHRERHVLYSRGKQGGYCLWSHTSVNLDAAYEDSGRAIVSGRRVVAWVKEHLEGRPLVARRHYIQTGTFRTFDVAYCDVQDLAQQAVAPLGDADGRILLPLCETIDDARKAETIAKAIRGQPATLIGVPEPLASLEGLVQELERWRWIERNTPGLKDDRYAAEEVARQLNLATRTLENRVDYYVGLRFATRRGEMPIRWFHEGSKRSLRTGTALMEMVSTLCDELFPSAPHVHNELINRKAISSAATLARTKLIERICGNATEPMLGLDPAKKPPEMAIYLSLLRAGQVHVESSSGWKLEIPRADADPCNLRPALLEIGRILRDAGDARTSVLKLLGALQAPPFGIRDGLLPLLLALYLQANWHRTALYEDGTYLHDVGSLEFVRLAKEPEHFELQHCAIEGVRTEVFAKLVESMGLSVESTAQPDLLDVVRPLAVFTASLPDYSRRTKELSATAVAVRTALLAAREPGTLIFTTLPQACGFAPFGDRWSGSKDARTRTVLAFADTMRRAIAELRGSYDLLLERLEAAVLNAFETQAPLDAFRSAIRDRCSRVNPFLTDPSLKPFVFRLSDAGLQRRQWLESIGSLLAKKPPERWADQDEVEFRHQLGIHTTRLMRVEAIAFRSGAASGNACHLVMTLPDGREVQHVFQWEKEEGGSHFSGAEQEIAAIIRQHGSSGLAAAVRVVWNALRTSEKKEGCNE